MGELKLSSNTIMVGIAAITVIYIISNITLQFVNKIIWDWFSKGRTDKSSITNTESNNTEIVVSMQKSHLQIEHQILKVLDVQNTQSVVLKELLIQVKNIKILKHGEKNNGGNPISKEPVRECLLLEDNQFTAPSLIELLEMMGHHVSHASTYKEAVELVSVIDFDFALVDYRLQGKETGADFWNYCKENSLIITKDSGGHDRMKIIVYSGGIENTPAGMSYLEKPLDVGTLRTEIERIINVT